MIELEVASLRPIQALDVTDLVAGAAPPGSGLVWLSVPHTTAALILCEADEDMLSDIERTAAGLLEPLEPFRHNRNDNPNGRAHLMSSLMGSQLLLPLDRGRLALGPYQRVIFIELDGPRQRRLQLLGLPAGDATQEDDSR